MKIAREQNNESDLQRALKLFKCAKDIDIQEFLHNKAIDYSDRDICYTYLICDESLFDKGVISIQAYFTLSLKIVSFGTEVNNTQKKRIAGYKDRTSEPVVLIGQLGKHITDEYITSISLKDILKCANEVICNATELIPCRASLVECSYNVHSKGLYENEGYKYLQQDGDLYQYYKTIE